MTDTEASSHNAPAQEGSRRPRTKPLLAILLVLFAALLATRLLPQFGEPDPVPPQISIDGLPPTSARDVATMYERARQDAQSAEVWGKLGMVLAAHSSEVQARECFRYAQALAPHDYRWPYLLAVSLSASDPPAAMESLRAAIAQRNDLTVAHVRLAELLLEMDQLDESQHHLDQALQREPEDLHALMALARLEMARGNFDASLEPAQKAAKVGPHLRATHELLAHVYQLLDDRESAMREMKMAESLPDARVPYIDPLVSQVLAIHDSSKQVLKRAEILLAEQRFGEAVEILGPAWENDPRDPSLPCELARALAHLNQPGLAAGVLERAMQQHPMSATVRLQRGVLYFLQTDYRNAADSFRDAIARKPDHAAAHFYLGESLAKLGERDGAVAAFRAAVALQPDHAAAHRNLGRILLEQGQTETAKEHLQSALQLVPDDSEALRLLDQATPSSDSDAEALTEPSRLSK